MKVFVPVVTASCGISAALAFQSPSTFRSARELTEAGFTFKPVRSIQARVIGSPPSWDATANAFLFKWYDTVELNYRGGMDTVNTASIEGALKYVQSEGIDYTSRGTTKDAWCAGRKNNMKHVMFLDITMAQPQAAVAEFTDKYGEFGPYSAMDSNQCTPTSTNGSTVVFSDACNYINGTNGLPKLGAYIGGEDRSTDARAPYPGTWWFSFPNTCALEARGPKKTDACRSSTPVGLCPMGTEPDGVACTFKYKVLGWVPLDDLVGITALTTSADANVKYKNFTQFCNDGKVEFKTDAAGAVTENIAFWAKPTDATSNTARAQAVVDLYAAAISKTKTLSQVAATDLGNFVALPTVATLTAANPKCYQNIPTCAVKGTSCKRDTYSQLCTVCTDASATGCVKVPDNYAFPALVKATPAPTTKAPTDTPGSTTAPGTTPSPSTDKSAASSLSLSVVSVASVAVSLALSFVLA